MRISRKTEYALRALLILAARAPQATVQIQELAKRGQIPVKFLEQILLVLKRAGLLRSKRGAAGGYQLNRPPSQITLGEVIRIVEGDLSITEDPTSLPSSPGCQGLSACLHELQDLVERFLDAQSLENLLEREDPDRVIAIDI